MLGDLSLVPGPDHLARKAPAGSKVDSEGLSTVLGGFNCGDEVYLSCEVEISYRVLLESSFVS